MASLNVIIIAQAAIAKNEKVSGLLYKTITKTKVIIITILIKSII